MRAVWTATWLFASLVPSGFASEGPCPNMCSSHGLCVGSTCQCFEGFMGGDCSQRECPKGLAWADIAVESVGHNLAECSNRGRCAREEGTCICDQGFSGKACEKMDCPYDCWGQGRCVSMRYNAIFKDPGLGTVHEYKNVWDANKIYGCICDEGHTGYDCSQRECPSGDDPLTTVVDDGSNTPQDNEVQILSCDASQGEFVLSFRGHITERISVSTTSGELKTILEATPGIGSVEVTFEQASFPVCITGMQRVQIEFMDTFGPLPSLVVRSTHIGDCLDPDASLYDLCGGTQVQITSGDGGTAGTYSSRKGTKEDNECSDRGSCDSNTGICTCYLNFFTSDGYGAAGTRGDCGYATTDIQACPGIISCSGHGVCSQSPTYTCDCSIGWVSGDCSKRACPQGKAWFDLPIEDDRAHQFAECSNRGVCDRTTGLCRCANGFEGAACDKLTCPGVPTSCSGHGTCLSMAQLAMEATENGVRVSSSYGQIAGDPFQWDFDMVHGCLCDEGWEGHDCSLKSCPTGDDPDSGWQSGEEQFFETQVLRCRGDGGTISLEFRREITDQIDFDASADALRTALTSLATIRDVSVEYSSGSSLCTVDASNVVSITFTQELGDVPALSASYLGTLTSSGAAPLVEVTQDGGTLGGITSVKGTKENWVCNRRGTCDHETGKCLCFNGYGSSDGNGNSGTRGDCGWRIPWATNLEGSSAESDFLF